MNSKLRKFRALLAPLTLLLCLALTVWAWRAERNREFRDEARQFAEEANDLNKRFSRVLSNYQAALQGTMGLFASSRSVEHHEWRQYVQQLSLADSYPAILGIGFIQAVTDRELDAYIDEVRFFAPNLSVEEGVIADHSFVKYFEPNSPLSQKLLGLDLNKNVAVKGLLDGSREQNQLVFSFKPSIGGIEQNLSLMGLPIYKNGARRRNAEERKQALLGWVFSLIDTSKLLEGALALAPNLVSFKISDLNQAGTPVQAEFNRGGSTAPNNRFETTKTENRELELGLGKWQLGIQLVNEGIGSFPRSVLLLAAGVLVSLLIAAIVQSLATLEGRAVSLAEKMTAALRESEKRFRIMADSAPVLIWTSDENMKLDYFNKSWLAFTGETLEHERTNNGWQSSIHPSDRGKFISALSDAYHERDSAGQVAFETEFYLKRFDGVYRWMLTRARSRHLPDGSLYGFIGSCIDITERRQTEVELLRAKEDAEDVSQLKSQFLASSSHHARTALFQVQNVLELAQFENAPETIMSNLEILQSGTKDLLSIQSDILNFLNLEAGQYPVGTSSFSLSETLTGLTKLVEIEAQNKDLQVLVHVPKGIPDRLFGDPLRLRQVLITLLANAIKYTPNAGGIVLQVRPGAQTEDSLVLDFVISDSGVGMSQSKQQVLHESFNPIGDGHGHASGLGLVIARRLIEEMGGELKLKSREGTGTAFQFELVFQIDMATRVASGSYTSVKTPAESAEPRKILLAEDNAVNAKLVKRILEKYGHSVTWAHTGVEVLEHLQSAKFDCIITDIDMPLMDGITATRKIRSGEVGQANISIVALTAHALSGDRERCIEAGMNEYLMKPISSKELIAAIVRVTATANK